MFSGTSRTGLHLTRLSLARPARLLFPFIAFGRSCVSPTGSFTQIILSLPVAVKSRQAPPSPQTSFGRIDLHPSVTPEEPPRNCRLPY
jgi:hypothetical protein